MDGTRYKLVKGMSNWLILPIQSIFKKDAAGAAIVPIPNCTSLQYVLLATTGVTCIALLLDLANRYVFTAGKKKNKATSTEEKRITEEDLDYIKANLRGDVVDGPISKTTVSESYSAVQSYGGGASGGTSQSHSGGEYGDAERKHLDTKVSNMIEDLMAALRTSFGDQADLKGISDACKENTSKITNLETTFMNISRQIDEMTVNMVSAPSDTNNCASREALSKIEAELATYKRNWLGLRRLLFCVDIHLQNSAHYQLFHHECDAMIAAIEKYETEIEKDGPLSDKDLENLSPKQYGEMVKKLEEVQKMMKMWADSIQRLCERSKTICPVHLRTEEVNDEVPVRALCNFRAGDVFVKEGDVMLLLNNTDAKKWKMMTTDGQNVEVPAVCCVIPPPELNTMKTAARVETSFRKLSEKVQESYRQKIDYFLKHLAWLISTKKFKAIDGKEKQKLLSQLGLLELFLQQFFKGGEYDEMMEKIKKIKAIVNNLGEGTTDAELEELMQLFSYFEKVANMYQTANYDREKRKTLVNQGIILDAEATHWETLAEVEEARRELSLAVSIHKETMAVGEAEKYETATGETRQTFSITGVIDPRDNSELSMDEAIKKGLINQTEGLYNNLKTGEKFPIPVAMNAGLIKVESTQTRKARELKKAIGVITVEFKKETRPYKIKAVMDPSHSEQIALADAVDKGMFDAEKELYINKATGETMSVENAIDSGFLIVEYDHDAEVTAEPEITKKTFAVSSALDRKSGKYYQFDEAVERNLVDKDAGIFTDTLTGQKINIVEAIQKKFMRGKVITDEKMVSDPRKLYALMSHNKSMSIDLQD